MINTRASQVLINHCNFFGPLNWLSTFPLLYDYLTNLLSNMIFISSVNLDCFILPGLSFLQTGIRLLALAGPCDGDGGVEVR